MTQLDENPKGGLETSRTETWAEFDFQSARVYGPSVSDMQGLLLEQARALSKAHPIEVR